MKKLFSRKLLVTVLGAGYAAATGHYQEAAAIVIGYLAGQSYVDAKAAE